MHTGQEVHKEKILHIYIHTREGGEKIIQLFLT